jgi:hypothetical protein
VLSCELMFFSLEGKVFLVRLYLHLSLSSPSLDFINAYELWVGKWLISELTSE